MDIINVMYLLFNLLSVQQRLIILSGLKSIENLEKISADLNFLFVTYGRDLNFSVGSCEYLPVDAASCHRRLESSLRVCNRTSKNHCSYLRNLWSNTSDHSFNFSKYCAYVL